MLARPARRIADPRENDSQEASDNAVSRSYMSGGPSVPACPPAPSFFGAASSQAGRSAATASTPTGRSPGFRAAYPGSAAGSENRTLKGHTS